MPAISVPVIGCLAPTLWKYDPISHLRHELQESQCQSVDSYESTKYPPVSRRKAAFKLGDPVENSGFEIRQAFLGSNLSHANVVHGHTHATPCPAMPTPAQCNSVFAASSLRRLSVAAIFLLKTAAVTRPLMVC